MKISLQWLSDYLPGALDAQVAADALTNGGFPVESIEQVGQDTVLDVEVTSNRGDCLCHIGVARELAALLNRAYQVPEISAKESTVAVGEATSVAVQSPLCSYYTARVIRNVKVGPSPEWLVRRLEAIGVRSINNVVDITNYVMMEMNQPLHAFDYDRLEGGKIVVRNAEAGETLTTIDGHERKLTPQMLVIADAKRPVALAGVMGGLATEVSQKTTTILLESANFDALNVRATSRGEALLSEASYRFERGIDLTLPQRASLRAAQMIVELAGGELLAGIAQDGQEGYVQKKLALRMEKLKQVLGIDVPAQEAVLALDRLGFEPKLQDGRIEVRVPSHRRDINIEVDLVEEVARVIGYDRVPVKDEIAIRLQPPDLTARSIDKVRGTLVAAGYFESITFSWVSDLLAKDFIPPDAAALPRARHAVRKVDGQLRPSLLPGLLESVRRNESLGTANAKLFEIGSVFYTDRQGQVVETRRIGLVGSPDVRKVRGVVEAILMQLNSERSLRIVPQDYPGYAKGASGRIEWGEQVIGHLGRIERSIADKLGLRELPAAAEVDLAPLVEHTQHVPQLHTLPRYPSIERDLSLVVPEATPFAQIQQAIVDANPPQLEALHYVTTYRGKPLEKGQKSVTVTMVFRSQEGTLTAEQVEPTVQKVVQSATAALGATLRT